MREITVVSKKRIRSAPAGSRVIDVTSRGSDPWIRFSPFYAHGGIPVPYSNGTIHSESVEGVWQGLKVFENEGVDVRSFSNAKMKGIKRSAGGRRGSVLGHARGVGSSELLDYVAARKEIYLPTYTWILQNKLEAEVTALLEIASTNDVVLLDYTDNGDLQNTRSPLSHASLIVGYLDGLRKVRRESDVSIDKR